MSLKHFFWLAAHYLQHLILLFSFYSGPTGGIPIFYKTTVWAVELSKPNPAEVPLNTDTKHGDMSGNCKKNEKENEKKKKHDTTNFSPGFV